MSNQWIDVHAHFTPPMTLAQSDARWAAMQAASWTGVKSTDWTAEAAINTMDTVGVAMQMLSNIPKTLPELRASNTFGASVVASHPGRFGLLAALPTDNLQNALEEIERAGDVLAADGFAVTCKYNGTYLSDPHLEPMWAELDRRKAVVFAHPDAYAQGTFKRPVAVLETVFETANTLVDMLYAGIFRRYPNFKLVLAHCGGPLPALSGRLLMLGTEQWVPNPNQLTVDEMRQQLSALFLDTAMTGSAHTIGPALEMVGCNHIVYGSDCGVPCSSDETVMANMAALLNLTCLTPEQIQFIGRNALNLFPRAAERLAASSNALAEDI